MQIFNNLGGIFLFISLIKIIRSGTVGLLIKAHYIVSAHRSLYFTENACYTIWNELMMTIWYVRFFSFTLVLNIKNFAACDMSACYFSYILPFIWHISHNLKLIQLAQWWQCNFISMQNITEAIQEKKIWARGKGSLSRSLFKNSL